MKIKWHLDLPAGLRPEIRTFELEDSRSWKGKLIRGHDIAEMIAHEFWEAEGVALQKLHIDGPMPYTGFYEVEPNFEPTFSAKRVESTPEALSTSIPASGKM